MTANPLGSTPITIPAHPLAVADDGSPDWAAQRLLTRYYVAAGATGVGVGVHTTQFEIHDDPALLERCYGEAADVVGQFGPEVRLVAGVAGDTEQALREAEVAAGHGYRAALLCSYAMTDRSEQALLRRARAVADVLPVVGFYMQESVGGSYLSPSFWERLFAIEGVVATKVAPFERYRTLDVATALARSPRWHDIHLVTGNDDAILADLMLPITVDVDGERRTIRFAGGLLGQWAVGTRNAVTLTERAVGAGAAELTDDLLAVAADLTAVNQAIFDPENNFAGAVAGVNELLRQQGLLASSRCLSDRERLSPGQADRIAAVRARFPELVDEQFIAAGIDGWRRDVA